MNFAYTNQLINETSPYLLQHAHNPVNWYPWCDEALDRAKKEDKPILVSIGYSACHWCHVMEKESFENEATAKFMNDHFINIKIDREERPDLDHIYMDAVQAMTGSGGWPLNVFLTPTAKPFYGGTYFPPVKAHNRASWIDVLEGVRLGYQDRKHEIFSQAENLTEHLLSANKFGIQITGNSQENIDFEAEQLKTISQNLLENADTSWGGFGRAPKFPQTFSIQFLLRQYHFTKDASALKQALLSLDKMIDGGIYDQLAGGFARYSTDNEWLAPHFEKMLYDNALLVSVLAEAYQLTKIEKYAQTIQQTIAFIESELLSDEGGFYSALDADSEGVEGKFYTWSKLEIDEILGSESAWFCAYYQVEDQGNWEHTNILWVNNSVVETAQLLGISSETLSDSLEKSKKIVLAKRAKRIRPATDDKILLGWNALMNTAYSKAYAALGLPVYKQRAIDNMAFLSLKMAKSDGSWNHTYKNNQAKLPAFLDDYAYLIQAYIHLQEITGDGDYLLQAKALTEMVMTHFIESETGFFYYTHAQQTDVILRKKEVYDGAIPSGNAVMALNLQYLSVVFDLKDWAQQASQIVNSLKTAIIKHPSSFGVWASLIQILQVGTVEIAILGRESSKNLVPVLNYYIPNKIIQSAEVNSPVFPLLRNKETKEAVAFYSCKNDACKAPFFNFQDFLANV
ncbi:MAG: thioredoxin domain-containing protein [Sediminibacterium sp.]